MPNTQTQRLQEIGDERFFLTSVFDMPFYEQMKAAMREAFAENDRKQIFELESEE